MLGEINKNYIESIQSYSHVCISPNNVVPSVCNDKDFVLLDQLVEL